MYACLCVFSVSEQNLNISLLINNVGHILFIKLLLKWNVYFIYFECSFRIVLCDKELRYWILMYVFTNSSILARHDTRSIFMHSLARVNSEISFPENGCHSKVKKPNIT